MPDADRMPMGKRFKSLIVVLVFICCLLPHPLTVVSAEDEPYGADAYSYLVYINENFPNRVNENSVTVEPNCLRPCGEWLAETMESFGYQTKTWTGSINDHSFISYSFLKPGRSERKIVIGAHYDSAATKGAEDNGTGVSMVLELAKRFYGKDSPLTLEFCFWDGEETRGYAGSYIYIEQAGVKDIELYINLDSIGAGDRMYAYGGVYEGNTLRDAWGLNMALATAKRLKIELFTMPTTVKRFRAPTRDNNSDQYYFIKNGVPYVYFEANAWLNTEGNIGNPDLEMFYNSALPAFRETNGAIIHSAFDDLSRIEELVPGRVASHLHDFSAILSAMLSEISEDTRNAYSDDQVTETSETTAEKETSSSESTAAAETESDESKGASGREENETGTGDAAETNPGNNPEESGSGIPSEEEEPDSEHKASGDESGKADTSQAGTADDSADESEAAGGDSGNRSLRWIVLGAVSAALAVTIILFIFEIAKNGRGHRKGTRRR